MVDKKSFYNTSISDKGINHVGHVFDTNAAIKSLPESKRQFSLSKNSHFRWIQLSNAIPKAWKENLSKADENFHERAFSGHHIIKKYQIYSRSKCNNKELYSL